MATYDELWGLASDNDDLLQRVAVACWVAAETIRQEDPVAVTNHAERQAWAAKILTGNRKWYEQMLRAVLAANSGLTTGQINGATDAQIQAKVDAAVDLVLDPAVVVP